MIVLMIFGIYILSIVFLHLWYRSMWIEYLTTYNSNIPLKRDKFGSIDTSLNAFYYWVDRESDVLTCSFLIYTPLFNTINAFIVIIVYLCDKIKTIKFVKL